MFIPIVIIEIGCCMFLFGDYLIGKESVKQHKKIIYIYIINIITIFSFHFVIFNCIVDFSEVNVWNFFILSMYKQVNISLFILIYISLILIMNLYFLRVIKGFENQG